MPKINVNQAGYAYIPKDLRDEGYEGELDFVKNHLTLVLFKTDTDIEDRKESLEVLLADLKLQLRIRARTLGESKKD